ncbi:acetate--CoA ligase family protein [Rhodoferax sp. GW822-FHT02A01]|uniref:acetate--CoA ligase family protein n=1 Tax=Rhodoferax sp. GW822-FHT02A01 TaxID=3141537 RepID=UPI00315DED9A
MNRLTQLFSPQRIAVFGGNAAAEAIRQCRKLGFAGDIWPVHPTRTEMEGLPCFADVASLPAAPDAAFVAVPALATVDVVRQLSARGAGGAICYASGFAEVGEAGAALQRELVAAAGDMALIGPNCYGLLNYLDGVALWPDQHGGHREERGVAIVTQSGNIGLNLTMQRRGLPLAYLITVGNKAGDSMDAIIEALLLDPRVTAIGMHIEGLDDVAAFSRVAIKALEKRIPLVALKAGSSELGARTTMSHTSSLAGPDKLYEALFARCGVARVTDVSGLLETLKFLHVHGGLSGNRIISASCSGGEASLVADLAQTHGLDMPEIPQAAHTRLFDVLGEKVTVANPLDYHTYIWGNLEAQTECFAGMMDCGFDAHVLVLDFPRANRCNGSTWQTTLDAFVAAQAQTGAVAVVLSSLPEGLPDAVSERLLQQGVAPMQGTHDCLAAIAHAARIGAAQARCAQATPVAATPWTAHAADATSHMLNEVASKRALQGFGVPIPRGACVTAPAAVATAEALGYPVVVKAVSDTLAHKTEAGGVKLGLKSADAVRAAVESMRHLSNAFLVEQMATEVVAEIIVGITRDAQFGLALTLGTGGILVELIQDAATLLLPASPEDIRTALQSLKTWPLLNGYRGKAAGDVDALVQAVASIAAYGAAHADDLLELDVNPILVLPAGRGVVAVDALIRLAGNTPHD